MRIRTADDLSPATLSLSKDKRGSISTLLVVCGKLEAVVEAATRLQETLSPPTLSLLVKLASLTEDLRGLPERRFMIRGDNHRERHYVTKLQSKTLAVDVVVVDAADVVVAAQVSKSHASLGKLLASRIAI